VVLFVPADGHTSMNQSTNPAPQPPLSIIVDHARCVNFALQQNGVRFVRRIALTNRTDTQIEELVVTAELSGADATETVGDGDPAAPPPGKGLARAWEARIARIAPGATYNLSEIDLVLSPALLARQTERESVELIVEARSRDQTLATHQSRVDVLAATEWAGGNEFPEILAAFVTPNHPSIERLLVDAGKLLREWTGDGGLSGYQSKSASRTKAIVAALYTVMAAREISYVNPPASFELAGQKVRLADQVLDGKLGTCLDLALVLAAAIEQAGLHPLLIIQRDHAFVGAWLVEDTFPDAVIDSPSRLGNRVDLEEMIVVEATGLTSTPAMGFDAAVSRARTQLADRDLFRWALDVRAARRSMIRPLPVRVGGVGGVVMIATESSDQQLAPASVAAAAAGRHEAVAPGKQTAGSEAPRTRIDRWKRKLLDLSLRNRLINFRETLQSVTIECPDIEALENSLAGGATFDLLPRPEVLIRGGDVDAQGGESSAAAIEARRKVLSDEFTNRRLRATLPPAELIKRLTGLYRAAKLSIDENGANTLFLTLGSLVWYESPESQTPRTAPLLLLPLTLERKSVREGFRIVATDEDPRINITLVEKLAQEFGIDAKGLREVPEDDGGVDVAMVLRRFREAIKNIDRWEVRESAHMGLFTFSKFLMWLDLQEREEDLRRSKVVTYLVDRPGQAFDAQPFPRAHELDSTLPVEQVLMPLDADSSQLVAAVSAVAGRTFVLEGPPGTGKSQTITNIIAQAMASGKRVLFVAEKMAALGVVHKRLERIGLAPFCLEVHSSKASKKEVLDQIEQAFEAGGAQEPSQWQQHAAQLDGVRSSLNAFVDALHRPRPVGMSFFQMSAQFVGLTQVPDVDASFPDVQSIDAATVTRLRQQLEALQIAGSAVGDIPSHPLREVGRASWQDALPDRARGAIDTTRNAQEAAEAALQTMLQGVGAGRDSAAGSAPPLQQWSRRDVEWLIALGGLLTECPGTTAAMLTDPGWKEIRTQLAMLIDRGRKRDALRTQVRASASEAVFSLELDGLIASLKAGAAKPWPLNWLACRGPRKALRAVWSDRLPENNALITSLEAARLCRDESRWLASDACEGSRFFGRIYKSGEAEWDAIDSILSWADRARTLLNAVPADTSGATVRTSTIRLATDGIDELRAGALSHSIREGLRAWGEYQKARAALAELLELMTEAMPGGDEAAYFPSLRGTLARWLAGLPELNDWCFWRRERRALDPLAAPFATSVEAGVIRCEQLQPAFEKSLAKAWVSAVSDDTPQLRDFNVAAHDGAIERFRSFDRHWLDLAAQIARARVAQRVPPRLNVEGGSTPATEMGVLAHQLRLQRRHMPVRRLIGKLPNLLPRLKPCFLMSPLSVAQYLDPAYPPFDLVVFDEASQIPVWDAVGAIARGSSVVVVGDSKQLPPTNFFQKVDGEEAGSEDEEDFEELESVLDECVASGLPSMRLLWHYRSRHESLIAFSNHHYYQGRLLTFPVPQERSDALGVSLRLISGGVYDRGGTRTNRAEAEAIVAELALRLATAPQSTAGPAQTSRAPCSIGIVTFSSAQQTLIEDLIDAKRRDDQSFDAAMNAGEEPVFVKNLENVQGDERDVILFSICYAPDKDGRMAMAFGPLNRTGGERRLNVAVTRARRQVIVFSSIRADQIDLARTQAVGAAHLKSFLEYADRGPSAIGEAAADLGEVAPTPLESSVRAELESRGWVVDAQIGCSGYKLDLAIRDPDQPGRYLLGIECDGAFYSAAHTARDRDRLRSQVLQGLDWRLHRVWSSEWRRNRAKAIERIEDAIRAAQRGDPIPAAASPTPLSAAPSRVMSTAAGAIAPAPTGSLRGSSPPTPPHEASVYSVYSARRAGDSEAFYIARSASKIAGTIRAIVEHEGPIVRALVVRRVAAQWGIERVTSRVEARIAEVLASTGGASRGTEFIIDAESETFWPAGAAPDSFDSFRIPSDDPESRRDAEHLPTREIASAAAAVLRTHIAMNEADLVRHTAQSLGFTRPTERISAEMRRGIADLARRGGCELSAGQARLPR